jgi:hypothetical protein
MPYGQSTEAAKAHHRGDQRWYAQEQHQKSQGRGERSVNENPRHGTLRCQSWHHLWLGPTALDGGVVIVLVRAISSLAGCE